MAGGSRNATIAREQRRAQKLGQRYIGGIVGREVLTEGPDPGKQHLVGMSVHRKVRKILKSLAALLRLYVTVQGKTAQHLRHLDVH